MTQLSALIDLYINGVVAEATSLMATDLGKLIMFFGALYLIHVIVSRVQAHRQGGRI